jgi:transcriptional regulator with XRE-family HTH domain
MKARQVAAATSGTFHRRELGSRVDGRFVARVLEWASNANILAWMFLLSRLPVWGAMPQLLGEKLRYLRQQRHLTQVELAQMLGGASQSHIANVEAQVDPASLSLVIRIAGQLHVSTDYLLRDSIPVDGPYEIHHAASGDQKMSFAVRLRTLRLQNRLSQRNLARRLGIASRAYIGGLEAGQGKLPSMDLVVRIADLFGVTTDYLLCDEV